MFVDTHCHVADSAFDGDREALVGRMRAAGVSAAVDMCCSLREAPGILALSCRVPEIWASVGVHPETGPEAVDAETLVRMADHPRVVAIGECGLDYYNGTISHEDQAERFQAHIDASLACGKPLSVHVREAMADALRQLENAGRPPRFVLHCFTGSRDEALRALALGGYLSFSGIVTFKNAKDVARVACEIPEDRILTETDCPYLAPVPHRGHRNEPAFVADTARFLARLRGVDAERFAAQVRANTKRLFGIDAPVRRPAPP